MKMSVRQPLLLVALAGLLSTTGCVSAVKQAYYEVKGAQGDVRPNIAIGDLALSSYNAITVDPVKTTLAGKLCPTEVVRAMDAAMRGMKEDLNADFSGDGKSLRLSTEIYYFQKKGILSGGMLVVRLYALEDDRTVADALVLGETNSFRERGEEDLAQAATGAIAEFLLKHHYSDSEKPIKEYRKRRGKSNES